MTNLNMKAKHVAQTTVTKDEKEARWHHEATWMEDEEALEADGTSRQEHHVRTDQWPPDYQLIRTDIFETKLIGLTTGIVEYVAAIDCWRCRHGNLFWNTNSEGGTYQRRRSQRLFFHFVYKIFNGGGDGECPLSIVHPRIFINKKCRKWTGCCPLSDDRCGHVIGKRNKVFVSILFRTNDLETRCLRAQDHTSVK